MRGTGNDAPNLTWPYFPDAEAMWQKHQELEERRAKAAADPELQEKLKVARRKCIEEMKKRNR